MKLLLVEDDQSIVFGLRTFFKQNGWDVSVALSVQEAERLLDENLDIVLLDIGLPDGSGFDVANLLKQRLTCPFIFITAIDDEQTLLDGFDAGADDYIVKPFRLNELKRRILAITKRQQVTILEDDHIMIDLGRGLVFVDQKPIQLSTQEYRLLLHFFNHKNTLLTRESLNDVLWESGDYISDNALSVTIKRLREKLGYQSTIRTIHGKGYMML
ncbi:response regulator transcription factor [Erysipelothrix anatis]|uniref:response regulator transcription factor n=1 Tax=Erysipelothrix anatis TaxID=2683713 RepID=UPI0014078352|nr:response regulator transcription factor [Erysipelothrix anatis]